MRLSWILLLSATALAQKFDAASVKPFKPVGEGKQRLFSFAPGGVTLRSVSAKEVIAAAYGVKDYQISGPAWLSSDSFEIVAKTTVPSPDDQLRTMLQDLLADRFKLAIHRESRELPVYAALAGKKTAALHEAKADTDPKVGFAKGGFGFQNYSMALLAEYLSHLRGVNRPVVDLTGIKGSYDFSIVITEATEPIEAKMAVERAFADDSILNLIVSQLGLRIEARKMMQEMLIVDKVERPTGN